MYLDSGARWMLTNIGAQEALPTRELDRSQEEAPGRWPTRNRGKFGAGVGGGIADHHGDYLEYCRLGTGADLGAEGG